jgi:hypothetical protein
MAASKNGPQHKEFLFRLSRQWTQEKSAQTSMSSKAAFETTFRITGSFQNKHTVTCGFLIIARSSLGTVSDFKITGQARKYFDIRFSDEQGIQNI